MDYAFYIAAAAALAATLRAITASHAVHALLYFIVSLLAVAVIFLLLGAHFAAALEVIVYAGAIMVLFIFVVMMLNPGPRSVQRERHWLRPRIWAGPAVLAAVLAAELVYFAATGAGRSAGAGQVEPAEVGLALFGPYLLGVEMASVVLLAGLVGAYHLGWHLGRRPGGRETGEGEA
ncbi:MAG: NADH-quinone oxidoreductase subunit J [Planctomycetes bacterium ADurb.Bin126]|jgi:NADH-quinone oxidoreductase subunit J|nr:MAG: NADH-quinone oxidoreductase subunit J [Planctomycetes bacterium ADurb.Bin126]HOG08226.1 NADH-quinone oxidoreductase subunit J [Syntrophales bacterium]